MANVTAQDTIWSDPVMNRSGVWGRARTPEPPTLFQNHSYSWSSGTQKGFAPKKPCRKVFKTHSAHQPFERAQVALNTSTGPSTPALHVFSPHLSHPSENNCLCTSDPSGQARVNVNPHHDSDWHSDGSSHTTKYFLLHYRI